MKKIGLMILILVLFFTCACVCASDVNETSVKSVGQLLDDEQNNMLAVEDHEINAIEENELSATSGTFTELSNEINSIKTDSILNLTRDYVYTEGSASYVSVEKSITINGNGHIIDGNNKSELFRISSDHLTINNLTFINGNNNVGTAITFLGNSLFINDCKFINNYGADILWFDSEIDSFTFKNNIFINNTAWSRSPIHFEKSIGTCNFINNSFTDNVANFSGQVTLGGGICYFGKILNFCHFSDNSFINNSVIGEIGEIGGGAIFFKYDVLNRNPTIEFINNTFINDLLIKNSNKITSYGGAIYVGGYSPYFLNNHFESLYADMGGAIYWHSGGGMFASNLFKNNSAKYGGVFYHMKNGGYSIFNDSFIMNKAFYDGGVFYIRSNYSSGSISYSKFINNSAGRNGGIIYIGGDALKNCGIYNSIFVNNTAMNGGILYCKADISDNILSGNIFIKNIAKEKGNILFLNSAISKSYISDSIFVNNYEGPIMYNAKYTDRNSEGFSYTCYNCWWGNTLANYNETPPNTLGIKFLNWYYLDINSNSFLENGESGVLNISLNNVYDVGTKSIQHYCSLNSINFNIISQTGSISTNNVTLNKGIGNITYFSKGIKDNISIFYENFNFTKLINYKIPILSVNTSDIIVGDVERIIVNTTDDVTGYINVTVLNETIVVYLINGSAEIPLSNIPVGKYDVYVTYGGDDIFISEKINSTFEVGKFNLILSTNVNDSHVGQPAMFNITLFNNLNILPVGNITMKIDNNQYFIPITGNNIIYSLLDLSAKSYSVELNYEGDENFDSACEILKFNVYVNETIISKDMTKNYDEGSYYSAKFVDKYGNPLINENVIFKIENMSYSVQTNAYGIAILYENLSSNTYKIIAINNVTGENKTNYLIISKNTPCLEIQNPNQHYNNQNLFILSLKSSYGNPLENIMLNIELNNKKYNLTTNSNGQTKLLVNGLTPNCYAAIISFEGNSNYYPSFTRINITIEKAPSIISVAPLSTVYNENKYLLINLKDDMGNPISGIEVSIGIEGIKYLKTDKNGQIKFSTNKLPPKSYNARITFIGNANYVKSTVNVKVTVKKATPKITAKSITFKKSVKTKKYKITLKDNQNKLMKNIKVVLKLNKKTYTAKTNKKGVATFKITNLAKKGTFKSTVSYKGNKYYNKVTKKAIIKVK